MQKRRCKKKDEKKDAKKRCKKKMQKNAKKAGGVLLNKVLSDKNRPELDFEFNYEKYDCTLLF